MDNIPAVPPPFRLDPVDQRDPLGERDFGSPYYDRFGCRTFRVMVGPHQVARLHDATPHYKKPYWILTICGSRMGSNLQLFNSDPLILINDLSTRLQEWEEPPK